MSRPEREKTLTSHYLQMVRQNKWGYVLTAEVGLLVGLLGGLCITSYSNLNQRDSIITIAGTGSVAACGSAALNLFYDLLRAYWNLPEARRKRAEELQDEKAIGDLKMASDGLEQQLQIFRQYLQQVYSPIRGVSPQYGIIGDKINALSDRLENYVDEEAILNKNWKCVVTQCLFREPVKAPDGFYYERYALVAWYQPGKRTCITLRNVPLPNPVLLPIDETLQKEICSYLENLESSIAHRTDDKAVPATKNLAKKTSIFQAGQNNKAPEAVVVPMPRP